MVGCLRSVSLRCSLDRKCLKKEKIFLDETWDLGLQKVFRGTNNLLAIRT